jgi:hypothetical protein
MTAIFHYVKIVSHRFGRGEPQTFAWPPLVASVS